MKPSITRFYEEEYFNEFLALEQRRCQRSESEELLMLLDLSHFSSKSERPTVASLLTEVLGEMTRDTDIRGWYITDCIAGVLFTEMHGNKETTDAVLEHISHKCSTHLQSALGKNDFSRVEVVWCRFPDEFSKYRARRRSERQSHRPSTATQPQESRIQHSGS